MARQLEDARRRRIEAPDVSPEDRALLSRVSLTLDPVDTMFMSGQADHYLSVGLSASQCVRAALARTHLAGRIDSVLDFPSGYGRVLRFLRAMFPDAAIAAAEVDDRALRFCKRAFNAEPVRSGDELSRVLPNRQFTLIWCGSLLTHFDEAAGTRLLRFFCDHLSPGGVCLVTTHGRQPVDAMAAGTAAYGLTGSARRQVVEGFLASGYGYADYDVSTGYGVSAISRDRMGELARATGNWQEGLFLEHGWDAHQDVYAFVKS